MYTHGLIGPSDIYDAMAFFRPVEATAKPGFLGMDTPILDCCSIVEAATIGVAPVFMPEGESYNDWLATMATVRSVSASFVTNPTVPYSEADAGNIPTQAAYNSRLERWLSRHVYDPKVSLLVPRLRNGGLLPTLDDSKGVLRVTTRKSMIGMRK
jgi:hypothetical protein